MTFEEQFWAKLRRIGKEESYARERRFYGDPSKGFRFEREKGEYMDRIKELLREWAGYYHDGYGTGYPKQSAFATERVQTSNRSTDTYRAIPDVIVKLNDYIERGLAPNFKRIIQLEYMDRRPQKTKAALLGVPREVFSVRLRFIHEQIDHYMFGR